MAYAPSYRRRIFFAKKISIRIDICSVLLYNNTTMKSKVIAIVVSIFLILIMPLTLLATGIFLPAQFGETYYGQLKPMYDKLYQTEGKKIVVLGNSAVAFGVDSALMEEELQTCGIDYQVRNFGLYGALGTKLMLDLSLDAIGKDDIVIFMPELITQSMSLYFSAEQAWRALDQDQNMLFKLHKDDQSKLFGGYPKYVAEKYSSFLQGGAKGSGVYASEVFDENGDMKNYPREYNTMQGGYDPDSIFHFEDALIKEDFVSYVNEYFAKIYQKGAKMYFYFAPINAQSVSESGKLRLDDFCDLLSESFAFPLLGNPNDCIMQAGWFFDANVHLNEPGMTAYTAILADAVKARLGSNAPSSIQVPAMPEVPSADLPTGDGDNAHAAFFLYEDDGNGGLIAVGLTEEGKSQTALTVPWSVEEKAVTGFAKEVFQGNTTIEEITIQTNIRRLRDGSFDGCSSLKKVFLNHQRPEQLGIATDTLLNSTDDAKFYVDQASIPAFMSDYAWSYYAARLAVKE